MPAAADAGVDGPLESLEQLVSTIARQEEAAAAAASGIQAPQEDDEEPGDYPQLLQHRNHSSSSSSSSSSGLDSSEFSSEEEVDEEGNVIESDRGLDSEDDDELSLRRALVLSQQEVSTNTTTSIELPVSSEHHEPAGGDENPVPETPVSKCSTEHHQERGSAPGDEKADEDEDDRDLPPFPSPPSHYPFASSFDQKTAKEAFDPLSLTKFGSLPASHVLVHLLRHTSLMMERRRASPQRQPRDLVEKMVAGGMGSALFPPKRQLGKTRRSSRLQPQKDDLTFQLLVICVLQMHDKRTDAIESLRNAVARERRCSETTITTAIAPIMESSL